MNKTKTLSKLALVRTMISPSDILSKKTQKFILGGYDDVGYGGSSLCNEGPCNNPDNQRYICECPNGPGLYTSCFSSETKAKESGETHCGEPAKCRLC